MVRVKGKNRTISYVVMSEEIKECMDTLASTREDCDICPENVFFFAVPNHKSASLRVSDILRRFAKKFKLSNIKTRLIRRLIATSLQGCCQNIPTVPIYARTYIICTYIYIYIYIHTGYIQD